MRLAYVIHGVLLRFLAGTAGSILLGMVVFRMQVFQFQSPESQCVRMGALASGVIALFRANRPTWAVIVLGSFGLFQLGSTWSLGPSRSLTMVGWSLFIGLGFCIVAVVFDQLARMNLRFGKFLVAGPLVGGIYLAATPLASLAAGRPMAAMDALLTGAFLGIIIGDGAGLGIELVELFFRPDKTVRAAQPVGGGR